MTSSGLEDVWRREAPHVLAALARRFGDFDGAEDAAQEALLAAATQWPVDGTPDNPRAWLIRVGSRRLIDQWRSASARSAREEGAGVRLPADAHRVPAADETPAPVDDTLQLLLLCCHPALTRPSQVALTLRAVGGLTTAQIAAGYLVPESTMAQRVSRAKATLRASVARFTPPTGPELPDRLHAVRLVLYLVFTEGSTTSGGSRLLDVSLTDEAIRLTRQLHAASPDDPESAGLLALMLLTDARRPARTDDYGDLVVLEHQDRSRWDRAAVAEGVGLIEQALGQGPVGVYQLQAAIAAVHDESPTWADTDWLQITMLYRMLERLDPAPMVTLNLAVAVGMAHGPLAGLAVVDPLLDQPGMQRHHRLHAVRAHLLEMAGRHTEAVAEYGLAARLTTSLPEQRYLNGRLARVPVVRSD